MKKQKKNTVSFMNWIKVISINILVVFTLIIVFELLSGLGRVLIGKDFRLPLTALIGKNLNHPAHPCNEMRTDVLLSHAPNISESCYVKQGFSQGEYVIYNFRDLKKPVILTLGGSTTSGFYQSLSDGDTYPKELANLAQNEYFILNGGVGGYTSLQELLKFMRDGPRIKNLELVISLNGINEVSNYHGNNYIREKNFPFLTDIQVEMNENQYWVDQRISKVRLYIPNLYSIFSYLVVGKSGKNNRDFPSINQRHLGNMLPINVINAAERWEKNVKRLNALVELEGSRYMLFLQPTLGLKGPQSNPLNNSNDAELFNKMNPEYLNEIRDLYKQLKFRCSKLQFCIDISDEVKPTGNVYSDPRHHNSEGNRILAKIIYDYLMKLN